MIVHGLQSRGILAVARVGQDSASDGGKSERRSRNLEIEMIKEERGKDKITKARACV